MVERVLNQDEIDALFHTMQSREEKVEGHNVKIKSKKKVSTFDFRQSDRISKEQIRSLHMVHDYFAKNFSSSLSAYLRIFVEIKLVSVEQMNYAEFLQFVPEITSYNSVSIKPLEGNIILEMNPSLVYPMIDILLGGPGVPPNTKREITEIEASLLSSIINLALRDLKEAWKPVMELNFQLESYESNPQLMQVISLSETVVAIGFEAKFGENHGMMNIAIPTILLKMIRHNFDRQWGFRKKEKHQQQRGKVIRRLLKVPLEVSGQIVGGTMTIRDFLSLQKGDIFLLPHRIQNPITICVENVPKYSGHLVKIGNMKGVKVVEYMQKTNNRRNNKNEHPEKDEVKETQNA